MSERADGFSCEIAVHPLAGPHDRGSQQTYHGLKETAKAEKSLD